MESSQKAGPVHQLPGRPWRVLDAFDKRKPVRMGVPADDPEGYGRQEQRVARKHV